MKISDYFSLNVTQYELDFVDVDLDKDCPLYIDPFLISISNSPWSIQADRTLKSFFNEFKSAMITKNYDKARELFIYMSEPKDNCFGISTKGTSNGKGVGALNTEKIVHKIIESNAIECGLVNNIEDIIIFVEDIDKDKLSDMCTNILRYKLIEYTKSQCALWNIKTQKANTLPFWDAEGTRWVYTEDEQLFIDNRSVLLVPKSIVSPIKIFQMSKYNWHFVIENERNYQLTHGSSLVRQRVLKNGKVKYYLPKIDVAEDINKKINHGEFLSTKHFIREYTLKNPNLFVDFVDQSKRCIKCLSNGEIVEFSDDGLDVDIIIDNLIVRLKRIKSGKESASEFHRLIKIIIEILFYPYLTNPIIEREIHEGRKRVDIVMDNNAQDGFFFNLHSIAKIYCPYVYIECKNYGKDVSNPEIDQLSSRFSPQRGQFGILICRDLENEELFKKRCIDTYKDQRGFVIYFTDNDIISMLNFVKSEVYDRIWGLLEEKKRDIVVS